MVNVLSGLSVNGRMPVPFARKSTVAVHCSAPGSAERPRPVEHDALGGDRGPPAVTGWVLVLQRSAPDVALVNP